MIEKPALPEFRDAQVIATLRETGEFIEAAFRPVRRLAQETARMAWWHYGIPFAMIAAQHVLQRRWPEIFQTVWAYIAMIAIFSFFAWKQLGAPIIVKRLEDRRAHSPELVEAIVLRKALEAQWCEREAGQ